MNYVCNNCHKLFICITVLHGIYIKENECVPVNMCSLYENGVSIMVHSCAFVQYLFIFFWGPLISLL